MRKTLNQIYAEIHTTRFRFRDVLTLRDYLALSILRWHMNGPPISYSVICCEDSLEYIKPGDESNYVLLSSREEIDWLGRMKEKRAVGQTLKSYMLAGS